jgi:BolA protein
MAVADIIRRKLETALTPVQLTIEDESHLHKGHAGHRPGGETHFRVTVISNAFAGVARVQRHRMVTSALSTEMNNPIHALALKTLTPEEAAKAESEA